MVNAVLLKPLPYRNAGRLVLIEERIPKVLPGYFPVSGPDVLDITHWTRSLESVAAFEGRQHNFATGSGEPVRLTGAPISANLVPSLGIAPFIGRAFTPEEDAPGHNVVLLSYSLWQERFAADPCSIPFPTPSST